MSAAESSSSSSTEVNAQQAPTTNISQQDYFCLKIQNHATFPSKPRNYEVALPGTSTVGELRKLVCDRENYKDDMFELGLGVGKKTFPRDDDEKPLAAFGVPLNKPAIIRITRSEKYQSMGSDNEIGKLFNPSSSSVTADHLDEYISSANRSGASAASTAAGSNASILGGYGTRASGAASSQQMVVYNGTSSSSSLSYTSDWNKKSASGYVGLSNQGATCYMNSLIQSLFMTPEFRRALYNWSYDQWAEQSGWPEHQKKKAAAPPAKDGAPQQNGGDASPPDAATPEDFEKWKLEFEKKSIPRQLQKLFAHLQLADSRAVQTKNLTKSFGWTDADAFTQHDVQELCRLLFEALEKAWKGTKQENLINELFQGKIKDYVKCSVCGHESAREDKFLDVALAVKAFGAPRAVESVEEALQKFVEPEILNGSNQYFCEKCNKKVDAEKGLKFTGFPYILMLQLKRFDFDYDTMRRIKLNDRVTFPQVLDLNPFLADSSAQPVSSAAQISAPTEQTTPTSSSSSSAADAEGAMDIDTPAAAAGSSGVDENGDKDPDAMEEDQENKAPPKMNSEAHLFDSSKERIDTLLANGPAVYELHAILIHRGSANGGHYYAYIKNLTDGKWNEFNDSSVSAADERSLAESFGESGGSGRGYWASSSGTNAYMLVYRQVDPARNAPVPNPDDIPEQVKNIIAEEERQKQEKEKQKQREREMVKFKIIHKDDKRTVRLHKSEPISKLLDLVVEKLENLKDVARENMRLRDWNRHNDVAERVIEDLTKRPDEQWPGTYNWGERVVVLETRESVEQEWFPVDTSRLLLRVFVFKNNRFPHEPEPVYVAKDATMSDIRDTFAARFGIPRDQQVITVESHISSGLVVGPEHNDRTLEDAVGNARKWGMLVWLESNTAGMSRQEETPGAADADEKAEANAPEGDGEVPPTKFVHHAPKHMKWLSNRVHIRFNHPDEPETKMSYVVHASGSETVGTVRERIAEMIGLSSDDFIIQNRVRAYYGTKYRYEEVNVDDHKLSHLLSMYGGRISEPTRKKVVLKRGKPARKGESLVAIQLMHSYPGWDDDTAWEKLKLVEPIGELLLPTGATVLEIRGYLLTYLKEKGVVKPDEGFLEDRIRLREMSASGYPSRITHSLTDKPLQYKYGGLKLTVQLLPAPEPKTSGNQVLFVQRWYPDEYRTGNVEELAFDDRTLWTDVARFLSTKYGVANVGLHKEWMNSTPRSLTQFEGFDFTVHADRDITHSRMDDGDWIFWRDNDAQLKELKKEEKDPLMKVDTKKREKLCYQTTMGGYYSIREKDLKIQQSDV